MIMYKCHNVYRNLVFLAFTIIATDTKEDVECKFYELEIDVSSHESAHISSHQKANVNLSDIPNILNYCQLNNEMYHLQGHFKNKNFQSGSFLWIKDAEVNHNAKTIQVPKLTSINLFHNKLQSSSTSQLSLTAKGEKSIIAIRVTSNDNETSTSVAEMSNKLFGFGDDQVNLVSQFRACSNNKLNFVPFEGKTITREQIFHGIGEISLAMNTNFLDSTKVSDEVLSKANEKYGNLTQQFDYVMLCLPQGVTLGSTKMTDWIGYAFVNSWLSVFNDEWCNSPTAQMHELGHNLGLAHSDPDYGDESGAMGFSYPEDEGPRLCFNGAKSFELGWYSDSHITIDTSALVSEKKHEYRIVGVADYSKLNNMSTILHLVGTSDDYEYFVAFNRKTGANSGTREGADKVLITRRKRGEDSSDSYMIAELGVEETYFIYNVRQMSNIFIWVEQINLFSDPAYAQVYIAKFDEICYDDNYCNDYNKCTLDYCHFNTTFTSSLPGTGVCKHTKLECEDCGSTFAIMIETKSYSMPERISWSLTKTNENVELAFGGNYTDLDTTYNEIFCVEYADYELEFYYDNTFKIGEEPPEYHAYMQNKLFHSSEHYNKIGSASSEEQETALSFSIVCDASDCKDFDACTDDVYDAESRLCTFEHLNKCSRCRQMEILVNFDKHPEQISWYLSETQTSMGKRVLKRGGPYPSFGRRKAPTISERISKRNRRMDINVQDDNADYYSVCVKSSTYQFVIEDSFGDGICCTDGIGNYTISLDGNIVVQGGVFESVDRVGLSTLTCSAPTVLLELYIQLDNSNTEAITWAFNAHVGNLLYYGGPYPNQEGEVVGFSKCINNIYTAVFNIYDAEGDGICCDGYYKILIDGQEMVHDTFNSYHQQHPISFPSRRRSLQRDSDENAIQSNMILPPNATEKCTDINDFPSTQPSALPSKSHSPSSMPSHFPSFVPSDLPTMTPTVYVETEGFSRGWSLVPLSNNKRMNSSSLPISKNFQLEFYIPKNKTDDQLLASIYDEACLQESNDTSISIYKSIITRKANQNYDVGTILIAFNMTQLRKNQFWSFEENDETRIFRFCVKSELLLKHDNNSSNISVAFANTKVKLLIHFLTGMAVFDIENITTNKLDASKSHHQQDIKVNSCVCDSDNSFKCLEDTLLEQNSKFVICLYTEKKDLIVNEVESLHLYQDGILKLSPIEHSEANTFTSIGRYSEKLYISTRITSDFFSSINPSDVYIYGLTRLDFDTVTSSRILSEKKKEMQMGYFQMTLAPKEAKTRRIHVVLYMLNLSFLLHLTVKKRFWGINFFYGSIEGNL